MSLLAMPFLVMNFGSEMVYILEQRLHAQKIAGEKSTRVLRDVSKAMFSDKFVAELLKPQPIYKSSATRDIFDRLAHSSIMRLSESSMDKLYDLMTMGFKYQVLSCSSPRELTDVTLNHIEAVRASVAGGEVGASVEAAHQEVVRLCKELSVAEFAHIRHSLAGFLQDRKVKVSLFLQDKIQMPDGTIVLPAGGPLPNDANVVAPGAISYFDDSGAPAGGDTFAYPFADQITGQAGGDPFDPKSRGSKLGSNLYVVDRTKQGARAATGKPTASSSTATSAQKIKGSKAAQELQGLAAIIGVSGGSSGGLNLKNLFGEGEDGSGGATEITIGKVDAEEMRRVNAAALAAGAGFDDLGDGGEAKDLGDLLDEVS